jgi:ABC-type anion transport system duplicated permease subunit
LRVPKAKTVHLTLALTWCVIMVPGIIWLGNSVKFVVFMSIYANIEASFAAYQAAKTRDRPK